MAVNRVIEVGRSARAARALRRGAVAILVSWATFALSPVGALTPEETPAPIAADGPKEFAWPKVRLAPQGPQDELDFDAWYQRDRSRISARVEVAGSSLEKAEAHCAAANHLLSHGLARSATCRLLQIPPEGNASCGSPTDSDLDAVDAHLQSALQLLTTDGGGNGLVDSARDERQLLQGKHDALSAFAFALRIVLTGEADSETRRAAASKLAPLRESDHAGTAAAAGLWQAMIRSSDADKGPAESILGNPAAANRLGALPYAYFAKLLRARLIDEQGSPAAAIAVLYHVDDRTGEWFPPEQDEKYRNACRWVRLQVLRRWQDRLAGPEREMERQWCKERIDELLLDLSGDAEVAAMSPTIPLLVTVDAPEAPAEVDDEGQPEPKRVREPE